MIKKTILGIFAIASIAVSCSDDDDDNTSSGGITAGEIAGGPFTFIVDGEKDNVSGVSVTTEGSGNSSTFVITDEDLNILGLPDTMEALEDVNFDAAGLGTCYIWYLSFNTGLQGAVVGENADDLEGDFALSNRIEVQRLAPAAVATITGGPFAFNIDGEVDNVSGIEITTPGEGAENTWVITDEDLNILGLPPTLDAVEGVNFDEAGAGTCFIWYLNFNPGLTGAEVGQNAEDLEGDFKLSNSIEVVRTCAVVGGTITGGPFNFTIDTTPDMVSGVATDMTSVGDKSTWVITDESGKILGLPPTLEALEMVDFNAAGVGTCLIWYLSFTGELENAEIDNNASDIEGCYDLSNSIEVVRS